MPCPTRPAGARGRCASSTVARGRMGDAPVRTIPVTVLAWEGPQARAYLARMARAGLRPERIVVMVRNPIAQRLGAAPGIGGLARELGARTQDRRHNHHPYRIRKRRPGLVAAIERDLAPIVPDPGGLIAEMFDGFDYRRYADTVTRVPAESYRSP